jgi:hypothetical protein
MVSVTLGAGTVQKLRVYVQTVGYNGTSFKIALYDNSLNLVVSPATATLNISDSGAWKEVTVPDTAITAGTYKIAWTALANGGVAYRYQNGHGTTRLSNQGYHGGFAGFPTNPLVDDSGFNYSGAEAAGVYIVP